MDLASMAKDINDVYKLLQTRKELLNIKTAKGLELPTKQEAPVGLPTATQVAEIEDAVYAPKSEYSTERAYEEPVEEPKVKTSTFWTRDYVKYPLIFLLSFGFFYLFLNFGAFSSVLSGYFADDVKPESQTQGTVLGVETPEYEQWIRKYFFRVYGTDSLSPNVDLDTDGLSNYQEYLLGTNPAKSDTDNDGYSDGQEILNGYNPLYDGKLTTKQQDAIKDWDLVDVNNRISFQALTRLAQGPVAPSDLPLINYDLEKSGEIYIPKLNVKAPVVWSKSPDGFADDLDRGVIHYPGTALPGQVGVAYISGHSSNFPWRQSDYSYVFTRINELEPGDEVFLTIFESNSNKVTLRYLVTAEKKYKPDDQAQFTSFGDDSLLNLSTCWPIGSISERYVVTAKLTGI